MTTAPVAATQINLTTASTVVIVTAIVLARVGILALQAGVQHGMGAPQHDFRLL